MKTLTWGQVNFERRYLAVGRSKTDGGAGRFHLIPSYTKLLRAHSEWYTRRFRQIWSEWYVFPFGKPRPSDPTRLLAPR